MYYEPGTTLNAWYLQTHTFPNNQCLWENVLITSDISVTLINSSLKAYIIPQK